MNRFAKLNPNGETETSNVLQWPMVADSQTSLIWQSNNATSKRVTFEGAEQAIANMNSSKFSGFDDWRLPTIQELLSIVDYTKYDPAIDTDLFVDTKSDWYWTSSPAASSPADYAWFVYFGDGNSYWSRRGGEVYVRAVRSVSPAAASQ